MFSGLFNPSHMKYDIDRGLSEPSIADMTEKAVKILKKNPKGFFLMVEGKIIAVVISFYSFST